MCLHISSMEPNNEGSHFLILLSPKLTAETVAPYADLEASHTLPQSESIATKLKPIGWFIASVASTCSSGIPWRYIYCSRSQCTGQSISEENISIDIGKVRRDERASWHEKKYDSCSSLVAIYIKLTKPHCPILPSLNPTCKTLELQASN